MLNAAEVEDTISQYSDKVEGTAARVVFSIMLIIGVAAYILLVPIHFQHINILATEYSLTPHTRLVAIPMNAYPIVIL